MGPSVNMDRLSIDRRQRLAAGSGALVLTVAAAGVTLATGVRLETVLAAAFLIVGFAWPLVRPLGVRGWTVVAVMAAAAEALLKPLPLSAAMGVSGLVLVACCFTLPAIWQPILPLAAALARIWLAAPPGVSVIELSIALAALTAACTALAQTLWRLVRERQEFRDQAARSGELVEKLRDRDGLTGLPNRASMERSVKKAIADGTPFALVYLDVDRFSDINSAYGPKLGDELLRQFAARLFELVDGDAQVFCANGDKFVVLAPNTKDKLLLSRTVSGWQDRLSQPFATEVVVDVTASAGVVLCPEHGRSVVELLAHAETALLRAKRAGRNACRFYYELPDNHIADGSALRLSLREALSLGQLTVYYQPQIHLDTGEVSGVEALARWAHPEWGVVLPSVFVPVAEEAGLIAEIGDWVLEKAASEVKSVPALGGAKLSVNVSAAQLVRPDAGDRVHDILQRVGFPPERLVLEVTETITISTIPRLISKLTALRDLGIAVSVDDFGTRYASLSYLKTFPVDELKIDKSFVADIVQYPAIPSAVLTLGQYMNLNVVAEGVETEAQADYLRLLGCRIGQGFLYARPMSMPILKSWMEGTRRTRQWNQARLSNK